MSDQAAPLPPNPDAYPYFTKEYERTRIFSLLKKIKPTLIKPETADYRLPLVFTEHQFSTLLSYLGTAADKHWRERAVASWAMGVTFLLEDKREQAITSLRKVLWNCPIKTPALYRERILTAYVRTLCLCMGISSYFLFMALAFSAHFDMEEFLILLGAIVGGTVGVALGLLPFAFPFSVAHSATDNNQARGMAAQALLRQNALEAMPELLEGSVEKAGLARYWSRIAVFHFLPQITEDNRNVMPLNSEELITRLLASITETVLYDRALGDAILDYLEKFGHGSNVLTVQHYLGRLRFVQSLSQDAPEMVKGRRILEVLKERQGKLNARQELLRHCSIPMTQPDQLLRPAADSQTIPTEQLLRASNSGE